MSRMGRHQWKGSGRTSDILDGGRGLDNRLDTTPIHRLEAPPPAVFAGIAQVGIVDAPTGRRRSSEELETSASPRLGRGWVGRLSQPLLALQTHAGVGFDPSA